jgi:hypothetical protein
MAEQFVQLMSVSRERSPLLISVAAWFPMLMAARLLPPVAQAPVVVRHTSMEKIEAGRIKIETKRGCDGLSGLS